jgi:asparagine synthase (glutamine-hydrolysing)
VRRALLRNLATSGDAVLGARLPAQQALVEIPFRRKSGPPRVFDARMRENWTRWKLPHWLRSGNKAVYGVPIEPRLPFMDVRLVEYAFRLPASSLVSRGWTKYLLRRVIEDLVPHSVAWRRAKQGYPFPIAAFLRDSKDRILSNASGCDLEGLRLDRLPQHYDSLVDADPRWLWRLASVVLWHRRCHLGLSLTGGG